ncbi:hypothetical protein F4781DRAFT_172937 [Annulohypoxylon bovei var. microspora]|nr:hypothetical protein F4781DRAFT_172937 [Annulohypoxylon bovei var. microspora]
MEMSSTVEGIAEFKVSGLSEACHTWYKVVGDLKDSSKIPLIILHGGPGACHEYLLPLTDLSSSIPLVFYDQIGNGRSTHLPDKAGDETFWSIDLFKNELTVWVTIPDRGGFRTPFPPKRTMFKLK